MSKLAEDINRRVMEKLGEAEYSPWRSQLEGVAKGGLTGAGIGAGLGVLTGRPSLASLPLGVFGGITGGLLGSLNAALNSPGTAKWLDEAEAEEEAQNMAWNSFIARPDIAAAIEEDPYNANRYARKWEDANFDPGFLETLK